MSQEFFDAEAQQHAADLDIVREIRHNDASLYQLAHGRGARWQFDQLKSQLEEKDAEIAELQKFVNGDILSHESCAFKEMYAENKSLKQQLEAARGVREFYSDYEDTRIVKMGDNFEHRYNPHIGKKARQWLEENK